MKAQTAYITCLRAMKSYTKPTILKRKSLNMFKILLYTVAFAGGLAGGSLLYGALKPAWSVELDCATMDLGSYDYTDVSTNRPTRNNNPGNIKKTSRAYLGETNNDAMFESFATPEWGYAAMFDLLDRHYTGLTLSQAIYKWSPPYENDTERYVQFVSDKTGLDRDDFIIDVDNVDIIAVAHWMSVLEGMKGFEELDVKLGYFIWNKCYRYKA